MSTRCAENWETCDRSYCQRERECAERAASAPAVLNAAPQAPQAAAAGNSARQDEPNEGVSAASPQGSATASEREKFDTWLLATRREGRGFEDMERADLRLMFPGHWEAWQARASLDAAAQRPIAAAGSHTARANGQNEGGGEPTALEADALRRFLSDTLTEGTANERSVARTALHLLDAALALQQEPKP